MSGSSKRKQRVSKLSFTENRGYGWHVNYRDPVTGTPKRHCFGVRERSRRAEAEPLYHIWLAEHLQGKTPAPRTGRRKSSTVGGTNPEVLSGSIIEIASSFLEFERSRVRETDGPRRRGTIDRAVFTDRTKHLRDFLEFLNESHGSGAVARMRLADLSMQDVEEFNNVVVARGYSASQVAKRIQLIKAIIDRAGRPEHGMQRLDWNWESRDVQHGKPTRERVLPTVKQLESLLESTDQRGRASGVTQKRPVRVTSKAAS